MKKELREFNYEGNKYIYISENEEYRALDQFLKEQDCEDTLKYWNGFFGYSGGYFICEGIRINMDYDDMLGMCLFVPDSISDSDLAKFRQWAARMYELSQDERYKV